MRCASILLKCGVRAALAGLILLSGFGPVAALRAQVAVTTLAGGRLQAQGPDAGFIDGDTLQASQFNFPVACLVDSADRLYVADRGNGAIRRLNLASERVTTLVTGLDRPVALAMDSNRQLYVLTEGDGAIRRFDAFGFLSPFFDGLVSPTALAAHPDGSLYVTEASGRLLRIGLADGQASVVASGLGRPAGIAVMDGGLLAVADSLGHLVRVVRPENGTVVQNIGTGVAGFRDGPAALARFNGPQQIAAVPGGGLVVADQGNHRVRMISRDGTVTTLYGVDPRFWEGPECIDCNPIILPGWLDGSADFAESRSPSGVTVSADGKIYTTEVHYHLIRVVEGAPVSGGGGSGGGGSDPGQSSFVLPPTFTPDSGYYPMGEEITVYNWNTNALFATSIHFTTDGSVPTTESPKVEMNGNVGTIRWTFTTRDLTALRLRAFIGTNASEIVSGRPADKSEIGVTRDLWAGPGSTVVIPIVASLRTNDPLKSLQFRAEITPASAGAPMISENFEPLPYSTEDLVPIVTSDEDDEEDSTFAALPYSVGNTRGYAIAFLGTNANFSIKQSAVVALLSVPIPKTAAVGSRYTISILAPSGTSDGLQASVPLSPMPPRTILVTNVTYLAGDSAPASWHNADGARGFGFGDGKLDNSDANNAFNAFLGERLPAPNTDLFSALDVFPVDTTGGAGGDGMIRYLDWQIIFLRSLGLDPVQWRRSWSAGGVLLSDNLNGSGGISRATAGNELVETATPVWFRNGMLEAGEVENAQAGTTVQIPISVRMASGNSLAGLAFKAALRTGPGAPPVSAPIQFVPAPGKPAPALQSNPSADLLLCGWPLVPSPAFVPALEERELLGYVRVALPATALPGQFYRLEFTTADGSPDLTTQYELETRSGAIWMYRASPETRAPFSDEWREHFLSALPPEDAGADADPDGDGYSNAAEYQAGTDPIDPRSNLNLECPRRDGSGKAVVLRWLTAPGKLYVLEATTDLRGGWTVVASDLAGTGGVMEWVQDDPGSRWCFFRVRLQQ